VRREHPIPTGRDYEPIKSFKLTLNHSAFYTVLHHRDGLITNLLNKIVNKHKLTVPYLISLMTSFPIKPHSWDLQSEVGYQLQYHNLGISPIPLDASLTSILASGLVKESTEFFYDLKKSMDIYRSQ
jgi:hypothetical protein